MSAYAAGLSPRDFWACTMRELVLVCQAHGKCIEAYRALVAWHLAPILNMFSKHRITPARLLGKSTQLPFDRAALSRRWLEMEGND